LCEVEIVFGKRDRILQGNVSADNHLCKSEVQLQKSINPLKIITSILFLIPVNG